MARSQRFRAKWIPVRGKKTRQNKTLVQQRIENEFLLAAPGGAGACLGSVGRIEDAGLRRALGLGIRDRGCWRRRARRQIEPALASAAPERERSHTQQDNGPSRR